MYHVLCDICYFMYALLYMYAVLCTVDCAQCISYTLPCTMYFVQVYSVNKTRYIQQYQINFIIHHITTGDVRVWQEYHTDNIPYHLCLLLILIFPETPGIFQLPLSFIVCQRSTLLSTNSVSIPARVIKFAIFSGYDRWSGGRHIDIGVSIPE